MKKILMTAALWASQIKLVIGKTSKASVIPILLTLTFCFSLSSCKKTPSEFDQLMAETMEIHDGDMRRMGELMGLKSGLKKALVKADSANLLALKTTLDELEAAELEMMQWMRNFAKVFPDGAMSHEGMNHDMGSEMDHSKMDHSDQKGHNPEMSDLDRLKAERKTMDLMRTTFNTCLDQSKDLIQKLNQ